MPRQPGVQPHQLEKIEKAYAFFDQMEKTNSYFTAEDIEQATGYKESVVNIYIGKKWGWFLRKDDEGYFCKGLHEYPKKYFVEQHRQKWKSYEYIGNSLEDNKLLMWLCLLIVIVEWYKISEKYKMRIWRLIWDSD